MATRTTPFVAEASGERLREMQSHRGEILEQLNRLLASPLFRSSRHYPKLLRFVVERTLDGQAAGMKERALGIEVFGRTPDYDTNLDPVVRTSACEVRKRIAQYYHEPGREEELRIDLPSGSYVPEFHFLERPAPAAAQGVLAALRLHPVAAAILLMVLALGAVASARRGPRSILDRFWDPVWNGSDTVMVCLGGRPGLQAALEADAGTSAVPSANDVMRLDRVAFADALTMGRLFSVIRAHGKTYDVRRGAVLTLNDLRRGPVVLIGAFNNSWTMRLKEDLRYTFEREPGNAAATEIRDRNHPGQVRWRVDAATPYSQIAQDYAIVSRVTDPLTEKIVVTVAGMTKDGTLAAGEFVTEERYLAQWAARAPAEWERRNVQVVLGTEIVNGVPGPPRVLAQAVW
ncbi:MAG: hypothetical protein KGN36_17135 [Acidobacteriota bacterium]|nr:hypothetical protein [Acidobacteriota bacterium]